MTATTTQMTADQMLAMIAKLQAENAALAAQPARKLSMKVTEKGGLSIYGLGRFPTTLYRSQWEKLLADDTVAQVKAFIAANDKLFAVKS